MINEILEKAKACASDSSQPLNAHSVTEALGGATFYQDKNRLMEEPPHLKSSMAYFTTMKAILVMSGLTSFSVKNANGDFHKEAIKEFYDRGYHKYSNPFLFTVASTNDNAGDITGGQLGAQIDLPLTDVLLAYYNEAFLCDDILTPNPAEKQSGKIGRIKNHHNQTLDRNDARVEGQGNVAQVDSTGYSYQRFEVDQYALMDVLTANDVRNVLNPFNPRREITVALGMLLKLMKEVHLASIIFSDAHLDAKNKTTLTSPLSDLKNSDFDGFITTAHKALIESCGSDGNIAVMDSLVFKDLSRHPQIRGTYFKDMSKSTVASFDNVRDSLQVEKLLVGKAYTAAGTDYDSALSRVWTKKMFLGHIPGMKSLRTKTYGFHHFYQQKMDYVISRQSIGNPQNEDIFAYMNWSFDEGEELDKRCGYVASNVIA